MKLSATAFLRQKLTVLKEYDYLKTILNGYLKTSSRYEVQRRQGMFRAKFQWAKYEKQVYKTIGELRLQDESRTTNEKKQSLKNFTSNLQNCCNKKELFKYGIKDGDKCFIVGKKLH